MKKPLLVALLILFACDAFPQQKEIHVQGLVVSPDKIPVSDAYVINFRSQNKDVTRGNGVFDVWVLPSDTLIITHVTFLRKKVTVFELMKNPVIQLEPDTISLNQVDVLSKGKTDIERAIENVQQINFDPRPKVTDVYNESERMTQLLNTENRVERARANSLNYEFSPSEVIGKIVDRIKLRKRASEYSSTKKDTIKQGP